MMTSPPSGYRRRPGSIGTRKQLAALGISLALLVACGGSAPRRSWNGTAIDPPTPAPALAGTNWNGDDLALEDLGGQVRVVFFGYTFCPDICPFALAKMKQLKASLGARADDLEVIFVSVDPNRDTVEKLSRYVPGFDERFYGLHISPDALNGVADGFGVTIRYGRPPDGGDGNRYLVDHTGTFFIVDRAGQLRLTFPPDATAAEMLPDIEFLISEAAEETLVDDFVAPAFLDPEAPESAAPGPRPASVPLDEQPAAEVGDLAILRPRAMVLPTSAAFYVTVLNRGATSDRLAGLSSASAALIELHESVVRNGAMSMAAHPDGFVIEPGGHVALEPGGKHGMMIEPRVAENTESLAITLHFETAGNLTLDVPIMDPVELLEGGAR